LERERREKIVFDGKLYYPSRMQFNDPFDCVALSLEGIPQERFDKFIDRRVMEEFGKLSAAERLEKARQFKQMPREEFLTRTQKLADGLGILCLSERQDNIAMWSHYANSHRGFCLEFDVSKKPFEKARRVIYGRDLWPSNVGSRQGQSEKLDQLQSLPSSSIPSEA
jgi:hypothetical protein